MVKERSQVEESNFGAVAKGGGGGGQEEGSWLFLREGQSVSFDLKS